jgi:hypothetical protein
MFLLPLLLLLAPSTSSILATELMHLVTGDATGASPSAVALGPSGPPTALVAQHLHPPIGLRAFAATAAPLWSILPPDASGSTLLQLAACPRCSGAVDSVALQYDSAAGAPQANCTLRGLSAAAGTLAWTVVLPACAAAAAVGAGAPAPQHVALAPDGGTLAAQLQLQGACVLLALEAPTGRELWRAPCSGGGGLGVAFSASGQWVLSSSAAAAVVHAAATGAQRGAGGCPLGSLTPPALSSEGDYIVTPAQGAVWVCRWLQGAGAYGPPVSVALEAWGQGPWLPGDTAVLEVGGRVLAGTVFAATQQLTMGRMFAFDVGCALANATAPCAVVDALLSDFRNSTVRGAGLGSIVAVGGYWFVGVEAGDNGGTLPTEFLFEPAATGQPWGTPVWFFDGMGSVTSIAARLVESTPQYDLLHVLAGGSLQSGGGGGGGHVYWHSINISK